MHPAILTMVVAWIFVIIWISGVIMAQSKHHPKALFILFFAELWERFSYYGMRALLMLYMTKHFLFSDDKAYGTYGAYGALVYATPVLGGMIADRYLGFRKAIMFGAILMALGHFAMAFEAEMIFYVALGLLIMGNGFFKPNISSLIGKLYPEGDPRRDSAFTIFYMGINTGAFLTPLTCGAIGEIYGWHYGFALAGIGMLIGLSVFYFGHRNNIYADKGLPPDPEMLYAKRFLGLNLQHLIYLGAFLAVPLFALLVNQNQISSVLLLIVCFGVIVSLIVIAFKEEKVQRERIFVILILFVFTIMFWTFFELAGSSITLFTERNVDRKFLGSEIPSSTFQSVNPFFIIVLAPLFAWFWEKLGKKDKEPSAPFKFGLSLIQLGLGFGILVFGAKFAGAEGLAPLSFLVFAYLLHTTGELCISPIGLSLVTKLAPVKIAAFVMGVWMLSSTFAHLMGAQISKLTTLPEEGALPHSPLETLHVYSNVFEIIAYISIVTGLLLMFLVPVLKKWMHGVK